MGLTREWRVVAVVVAGMVTAINSVSALAQQIGNDDTSLADGILVTSGDVGNCPYRLVQPVTINVTEDFNADTRTKIHDKFRKAARKAGADAVVKIERGGKHMTAWAFNRREYHGSAIRFVDKSCAPSTL